MSLNILYSSSMCVSFFVNFFFFYFYFFIINFIQTLFMRSILLSEPFSFGFMQTKFSSLLFSIYLIEHHISVHVKSTSNISFHESLDLSGSLKRRCVIEQCRISETSFCQKKNIVLIHPEITRGTEIK